MVVSNLGLVLAVVGATGSTLISYILPGACYALIYRERSLQRYLAIALCLYGLAIVPVCLTVIAIGGSGH
jgi:amino acid permease